MFVNSNSWNEHVIEIVLPKPCCLGHVDLRFHLQQAAGSSSLPLPRIEATLLVQHIANIGSRRVNGRQSAAVDEGVRFGLNGAGGMPVWKDTTNPVATEAFLSRYSAEIVCGPLELMDYLDTSGQSGFVTFASSNLLNIKSKSLLIHLKALPPREDSDKHAQVKAVDYYILFRV